MAAIRGSPRTHLIRPLPTTESKALPSVGVALKVTPLLFLLLLLLFLLLPLKSVESAALSGLLSVYPVPDWHTMLRRPLLVD